MQLETRTCICQKTFKVLPQSQQNFCSQYCDPKSSVNVPQKPGAVRAAARKREAESAMARGRPSMAEKRELR